MFAKEKEKYAGAPSAIIAPQEASAAQFEAMNRRCETRNPQPIANTTPNDAKTIPPFFE